MKSIFGFFLVWLTMYLYYRRRVRKLNDLLYERKNEGSENE